jgi:hypothetical protein
MGIYTPPEGALEHGISGRIPAFPVIGLDRFAGVLSFSDRPARRRTCTPFHLPARGGNFTISGIAYPPIHP